MIINTGMRMKRMKRRDETQGRSFSFHQFDWNEKNRPCCRKKLPIFLSNRRPDKLEVVYSSDNCFSKAY